MTLPAIPRILPDWLVLGALVRLDARFERFPGRIYRVERVRPSRMRMYGGHIFLVLARLQTVEAPFYVNGKEVRYDFLLPARLPSSWAPSPEADLQTRYTPSALAGFSLVRTRVSEESTGT